MVSIHLQLWNRQLLLLHSEIHFWFSLFLRHFRQATFSHVKGMCIPHLMSYRNRKHRHYFCTKQVGSLCWTFELVSKDQGGVCSVEVLLGNLFPAWSQLWVSSFLRGAVRGPDVLPVKKSNRLITLSVMWLFPVKHGCFWWCSRIYHLENHKILKNFCKIKGLLNFHQSSFHLTTHQNTHTQALCRQR